VSSEIERAERLTDPPPAPRRIWVTLEAPEVIDLKRVALDHDVDGAIAFFRNVVTPRVRAAAAARGITRDISDKDAAGGNLPG
jgi:hypothetical protein